MRSLTRVLTGVVAVGLVATACGGGGGGGAESKVKSFVVNINEPKALLPENVGESEGGAVDNLLFRGLTDFDPKTGKAIMMNAESITSSDRKHWTVKLKDGWTFSDGEKITAHNYVDAWNADLANGWSSSYFLTDMMQVVGAADVPKKSKTMSGLKVVDDKTFTIDLAQPNTNLPLILGGAGLDPLPDSVLKSKDWKAYDAKPISNGPYMMDGSWEHNSQIKVKRNPKYAGPDKGKADAITLKIYGNPDTAYNDAVAGNLDIVRTVPPDRLAAAPKDFGDNYIQTPSSSFNYYGFPMWRKEFKDLRIRQAISMAIDRNTINKQLLNNTVVPAKGIITPLIKLGHRDDPCGEPCTYNPTKAKQLYDAAGGIPGNKTTFWFNAGGGHDQYVQAIANELKKNLGLTVSIKSQQWAQYLQTMNDHKVTGPFRLGWIMDYPSPSDYLGPIYGSKSNPATGYNNKQFDKLVAQGDAAPTPQAAVPYYHKAEDLILKDMPILPLWFGKNQVVHTDHVTNLKFNAMGGLMLNEVEVKS